MSSVNSNIVKFNSAPWVMDDRQILILCFQVALLYICEAVLDILIVLILNLISCWKFIPMAAMGSKPIRGSFNSVCLIQLHLMNRKTWGLWIGAVFLELG